MADTVITALLASFSMVPPLVGVMPALTARPGHLFHLAVVAIGVGTVVQDRADRLVHQAAGSVLADELQVVVLDRELVAAELEVAAYALEVGGLERRAQRLLVLDASLHLAHRRVDEQRGVV